jgi:decaprenyl-phosphate phosphoribosyltransferase
MFVAILKSLRFHQWVKNLFVLGPLVFARRVDDPKAVLLTALAVACFCLLSSAVYVFNDIVDVEKDRAHPLKRLRPIASGALPIGAARVLALILALLGLGGSLLITPTLAAIAAAYLTQNVLYSFWLKHVPFVDVACISAGFLLRVLGGASAIPVDPSGWLLLCTLLLAAFLGFGKRAHELRVAGGKSVNQRLVLDRYPPNVLRVLLYLLAILTIAAYILYTQSFHAIQFFGTRRLALTIPFVIFGVLRFIWITQGKVDSESPTDSMLRDPPFMINLLGYAIAIISILYAGW